MKKAFPILSLLAVGLFFIGLISSDPFGSRTNVSNDNAINPVVPQTDAVVKFADSMNAVNDEAGLRTRGWKPKRGPLHGPIGSTFFFQGNATVFPAFEGPTTAGRARGGLRRNAHLRRGIERYGRRDLRRRPAARRAARGRDRNGHRPQGVYHRRRGAQRPARFSGLRPQLGSGIACARTPSCRPQVGILPLARGRTVEQSETGGGSARRYAQ